MGKSKGYVKIYRDVFDDPALRDGVVFAIWIYLLLNATRQEWMADNVKLKPGQLLINYSEIVEFQGFTLKQVRRAVLILKKGRQICTARAGNKLLITIENWAFYQSGEKNRADLGQTEGQTDDEKRADLKKPSIYITRNTISNKNIYGEFHNVALTEDERQKLSVRMPGEDQEYIDRLSEYLEQLGPEKAAKKYNSHYATILAWHRRDEAKRKEKNQNQSCHIDPVELARRRAEELFGKN